MKVILILCLIGLFSYLGYSLSLKYTKNRKFLLELSNFLTFMKGEINFKSKKLTAILEEYKSRCKSSDFITLLNNYLLAITSQQEVIEESLFKNINDVTKSDKEIITNFFYNLGKKSTLDQISEIDAFAQEINKSYSFASAQCKKYCPLYIKLGLLCGLFVALLFI